MQTWPDPPPPRLARWALKLRNWLRLRVAELLPGLTVFEDTIGTASSQVLAAVARHRIPDHLEEGPQTAAELANRLGLQADPLHRLLRAMVGRGYFRLDRQGRFRNSRLSRELLSSNPERPQDFCEYFASPINVECWSQLEQVLQTGRDAFELVYAQTVWDRHREHPEENRVFARAMHSRTVLYAPAIAMIYPFHEVVTVCDVAGGQGALLSEVALRHPHLHCTLYEMEPVLAQADRFLTERGVGGRIERLGGDIFHSVPVAYDAYLLKNVLHDWDDPACLQVLDNIRQAMLPDSRLLVIEYVQERNRPHPLGSVNDLQMLVVTAGGRERSLAEFDRLFQQSGLERTRLWHTATMSVLEARLPGGVRPATEG